MFLQTSALGQGLDNGYGLIGAIQSKDRRYLEYVDGSIMHNGQFYDVSAQYFGDVYGTGGNLADCLMINSTGNVGQCDGNAAKILCEKYIDMDTIMCLGKTTLVQNIQFNTSTKLNFLKNYYPSMCLEHCRALDDINYAIVDQASTAMTRLQDTHLPETSNYRTIE